MKIPALISVIALAFGTAAAAQTYTGPNDTARSGKSSAVSTDKANPSNEGLIDKTKNALRRMGDKMRNSGKVTESTVRDEEKSYSDTQDSDTRAMGAGSDRVDPARRARMDEAYSNWQSKQK